MKRDRRTHGEVGLLDGNRSVLTSPSELLGVYRLVRLLIVGWLWLDNVI